VGAHPRSLGQVCDPSPALHRPGGRSCPDPALVCPAPRRWKAPSTKSARIWASKRNASGRSGPLPVPLLTTPALLGLFSLVTLVAHEH
jgi:hypothetical protein